MKTPEIYAWREPDWQSVDLTGFDVVASDGEIGKVEKTTEANRDLIVVDTGPWFGEKVALPAGTIELIDFDEGRVFVERTKDEIKDAPRFADDRVMDEGYRNELGRHHSARQTRATRTTTR